MGNHLLKSRLGRKLLISSLSIAAAFLLGAVAVFVVLSKDRLNSTNYPLIYFLALLLPLTSSGILLFLVHNLKKANNAQGQIRTGADKLFQGEAGPSSETSTNHETKDQEIDSMSENILNPEQSRDSAAKDHEKLPQIEQRRVQELDLINQINQTLLASVDFEITVDAVLRNVRSMFDYASAEITIWNPEQQLFEAYVVGDSSYTMATGHAYAWGEGYTGWLAEHQQPLLVPVVDECQEIQPKSPASFPFKAFIGLPLTVGEEFLGTFELAHHQPNSYTQEDVESLTRIVNQAAVALKHAKLFQENERHARTQTELAEIASLASTTLNLDELLRRIMERIVQAVEADIGAVLLLNKEENGLYAHPAGAVGISPQAVESFFISTTTSQFQDAPLSTGRPFLSDNAQTDKRVLPFYQPFIERLNIKTVLIVPLTTADKNVGEIYVMNKPTPFTPHDLVLLSSAAVHFAAAIVNATLFETTQRNLTDLAILNESAADLSSTLSIEDILSNLARRLTDILSADACSISGYDETTRTLIPIYEGQTPSVAAKLTSIFVEDDYPIIKDVLQTRQAQTIEVSNSANGQPETSLLKTWGVSTVLLLPLVARNNVIGLIEIFAKQPAAFRAEEINLAQTLANQAAIALQNAQLYEEADAQLTLRLKELSGLQTINKQLNSTLDLNIIIRYVIEEAVQATGANFGNVRLYEADTNQLTMYIHKGWPEEVTVQTNEAQVEPSGIIARVLEAKTSDIIDKVSQASGYTSPSASAASAMVVPILNADLVEGIIILESTRPAAFTRQQLQYVEALSDQAAIAIRNAKDYATLMEERRQATTRVNQLAKLSDISRAFRANLPLTSILEDIAFAIQETVGFHKVLLSLARRDYLSAVTGAGIPIAQLDNLKQQSHPVSAVEALFLPEFRLGDSYFIPQDKTVFSADKTLFFPFEGPVTGQLDEAAWHPGDVLLSPLRNAEGALLGLLSVTEPTDGRRPTNQTPTILEVFANQAATAIENSNLFQELQHRVTQLKLFSQINSHISAILDPNEILKEVVNLIANAFSYYYIQVYQLDSTDSDYLVSLNGAGTAPSANQPVNLNNRVAVVSNSIVGWVAKNHRPLCVNDVRHDSRYLANPNLPDTLAEIALPLRAGETIFGVLDIQHDEPNVFDQDDTFNLQALADQLAVATQNAHLFEEEQRRAAELEILNQTGQAINATTDLTALLNVIQEQVAKLMNADNMFIALYDQETHTISFPLAKGGPAESWEPRVAGNGITEYIISNKRPLLLQRDVVQRLDELGIDQIGQVARSWLGVPMMLGDQALGVIGLQDYEQDNAYSGNELNLLSTIAAQATIALQNSRLLNNTRTQANEMRRLYELGVSISQETDLNQILQSVITEALALTGREFGAIWLLDEARVASSDDPDYLVEEVTNLAGDVNFQFSVSPEPDAPAKQVIEQGTLLLINDIAADPQATEATKQSGIRACIGVPLNIEGHTVGAMFVHSLTPYRFDDHDIDLLQFLVTQAAVTIQNAQSIDRLNRLSASLEQRVEERTEELRQQRDRVNTLYHIARQLSASLDLDRVLNEALHLLDRALHVTQGAILLVTPTSENLIYRAALGRPKPLPRGGKETRYKIGVGMAGYVLETRKPYISDNLAQDDIWMPDNKPMRHRSVLAVPLITAYDALGVVMLFHAQENYFTENHLELVTAAAPMIATTISNADLYTLITEQAERVGTLLRKVQAEDSKNKAIIEGIADGVLVIDPSRTIQLANSVAAAMLGTDSEMLAEKRMEVILTLATSDINKQIAQELYRIITVQQSRLAENQAPLTARIDIGGKAIIVLMGTISLAANTNVPPSILVVLRDISREAELDRIKDEFISTVSHELRTPMTPIKGYTDLLVNNKVGPLNDLQLKFLRVIKTNADRLDSLVNDILDISRIDAERVKLDNKPIKLSGLIRQVLPTFEYQIGEKNLALTLHIPDSLPPVYADPDRVTQILVNLIGNSVKYSRPDDKINIVVTAQNDYVRVDIQDTGLGISEEDLAQVFDRFFRAERDVSSVVDGTGLGLPIAKNFVELMGGKIWASSELEVGSTFSFTLPAAKQNPIDGNEPTV